MKESVTIKGISYKIKVSVHGNFYIEKPFYTDYQIPNPITFASKFGTLSAAKIPSFVDEQQFSDFLAVIESINNLPDEFIKEIKRIGCLGNFISNLNKPFVYYGSSNLSFILQYAFYWSTTPEGFEYWNDISEVLEKLEKSEKDENYENRLQKQEIDRSGSNRSEGNRLRCRGDIFESSTRYSGYQARARKSKNALRSSKVYISTRCGCVHRG